MFNKLSTYYKTNKKLIFEINIVTISISIISYYLFIVNGYALPDGLCEGLYYYENANWHLACGRWAVSYLNTLIGNNIVMPLPIVIIYSMCISTSVLLLKEKWLLKNKVSLFFIVSAMVTTPATIAHFTFPHVALTFSFSFLLTILFYIFVTEKKYMIKFIGVLCFTISMGLYQSYIGAASSLIILGSIIDILNRKKLKSVFQNLFTYTISGIFGCLLNIFLYKLEMFLAGTNPSERVNNFNIAEIFTSIKASTRHSYVMFIDYFSNNTLYQKYFYIILFAITLISMFYLFKKEYSCIKLNSIILCIIFILVTPLSMNLIHILIPYNGIGLLMCHHYILIIPFSVAIIEFACCHASTQAKQSLELLIKLSIGGLTISGIIMANATFESIRISYDAIKAQTSLILSDVYDVEGFVPNTTPIMFAGFPNDNIPREQIKIYEYAIPLYSNVVYWEDMIGIKKCRQAYLLNYCGIDGGTFSDSEYLEIINSDTFKSMPLWPAKNSTQMIHQIVVVKLSDTPPGYESNP